MTRCSHSPRRLLLLLAAAAQAVAARAPPTRPWPPTRPRRAARSTSTPKIYQRLSAAQCTRCAQAWASTRLLQLAQRSDALQGVQAWVQARARGCEVRTKFLKYVPRSQTGTGLPVRVLVVITGELTNGETRVQCACRARKSSMGPNCPSNVVPPHALWGGQCSIEPNRVPSGPRKLSADPST